MKKLLAILLFLPLSNIMAQVSDWTASTCDLVEYNMYTELEAGNAVILDFAGMWCAPCQTTCPELQSVWESYGNGSGGVKIFEFLIQDVNYSLADCADLNAWEGNFGLTFPGFVDVDPIHLGYEAEFGNNFLPLILVFVPNTSDPSASTLVYHFGELGEVTGDVSADIILALQSNGFFPVGITETNAVEWSVYPNPSTEQITIKADGNELQNPVVSMQSLTGKVLQSNLPVNEQIDVSRLANGVYLLNIESKNGTQTVEFVKQ